MTIQIIGAGFGRTGTLSLKVALEILGYNPCYHMSEVFQNPEHIDKWIDVDKASLQGDLPLLASHFKSIFGGDAENGGKNLCNASREIDEKDTRSYKAIVDFPGCTYYKELMEVYPNAKVILSVRDSKEAWYQSFRDTIGNPKIMLGVKFLGICNLLGPLGRIDEMFKLTYQNQFQNRFRDEEFCTELYRKRVEEVMEGVPKDRLLVFNVKEGWGPLCEFLGVPIPPEDQSFPRVNDKDQFKRKNRSVTMIMDGMIAALIGLCLVGLYHLPRTVVSVNAD